MKVEALAALAAPGTANYARAVQVEAEAEAKAEIVVEDAEDYTAADEYLTKVVRRKDAIVAMRQSATGPLKSVAKTIESWFKPGLDALALVEGKLKSEMGSYRLRAETAEREAYAEAQAAAEAHEPEALVTALTIAQAAGQAPAGRASVGFCWKVKRVVPDLLPDEYWVVDARRLAEITAAAGSSEDPPIVPGVIFEREARVGARR